MMQMDAAFLYYVLSSRDASSLLKVDKDWLLPRFQEIRDYIFDCIKSSDMKAMPDVNTIAEKYNINFPKLKEGIGFYIKELRERAARDLISKELAETIAPLMRKKEDTALNFLKTCEELMILGSKAKKITRNSEKGDSISLVNDSQKRWDDYIKRKEKGGVIGFPFPWEGMNKSTGGLIPGELSFIFARSGVGKSWFAIKCAAHLFMQGYNVLFVSGEMSPMRVTYRYDALLADISQRNFREGNLSVEDEMKYKTYCKMMEINKNDVKFYGAKDIKDLASLELYLSQHANEIDVVIYDSAYLPIRKEKWEDRADYVKNLKLMAEEYQMPFLCTWQFSRKFCDTKDKDLMALGQESIAFTDGALTDCDNAFGIMIDDAHDQIHQAKIFSIKTRDGMRLKDMMIEWDHENRKYDMISYDIPGVGAWNKYYQHYGVPGKRSLNDY